VLPRHGIKYLAGLNPIGKAETLDILRNRRWTCGFPCQLPREFCSRKILTETFPAVSIAVILTTCSRTCRPTRRGNSAMSQRNARGRALRGVMTPPSRRPTRNMSIGGPLVAAPLILTRRCGDPWGLPSSPAGSMLRASPSLAFNLEARRFSAGPVYITQPSGLPDALLAPTKSSVKIKAFVGAFMRLNISDAATFKIGKRSS
jgi:hypothetical protein